MKTIGIIPARLGSTRFPKKVLADLMGRPMIQWVWEAAKQARCLEDLIIAVDDKKVMGAVQGFGGKAVFTSSEHISGTDRISELARDIDTEVVINIQADEPMLDPSMIDDLASVMLDDPSIEMATLAHEISDPEELDDPNVVKVVLDEDGYALRFSRSDIPSQDPEKGAFKHIGMYAYRKEILLAFTELPPTDLEKKERLEQLRAMENGIRIKVVKTPHNPIGVDTPEDLDKVKKWLSKR